MNERAAQDWNPRDPAVLHDQQLAYGRMRERCPVAFSEFLGWSIFRHEDVLRVLTAPDVFSSASAHRAVPNGMDEPDHSAYRTALEPFFTPERMAAFEPVCRSIARDLAARLPTGALVELIGAYIHPFALQAHCAFLGWPVEIWEDLHGWTHGNQDAGLARDPKTGAALAREFANLVGEELRDRRRIENRGHVDVTTELMTAEVHDQPLTEDDIISLLRNWTAGQGTVSAGIGLVVLRLVQDHALQATLRGTPDTISNAIDEMLRVDGPLVANRRTTTRAVEIGGRTIESGEKLTLMWIAADRDGRVFDDPDSVRLGRDQAQSLLFGAGIHDCLGAPLARLEMRVAVEELLARARSVELGPREALRRAVYPSNGLQALPVLLH